MVPGRVAHASGESPIAPCWVIGRRHIAAPQQQPFVLVDIAPLTHELLGTSFCPQTFGSLANTLALTITLALRDARARTQRVRTLDSARSHLSRGRPKTMMKMMIMMDRSADSQLERQEQSFIPI